MHITFLLHHCLPRILCSYLQKLKLWQNIILLLLLPHMRSNVFQMHQLSFQLHASRILLHQHSKNRIETSFQSCNCGLERQPQSRLEKCSFDLKLAFYSSLSPTHFRAIKHVRHKHRQLQHRFSDSRRSSEPKSIIRPFYSLQNDQQQHQLGQLQQFQPHLFHRCSHWLH